MLLLVKHWVQLAKVKNPASPFQSCLTFSGPLTQPPTRPETTLGRFETTIRGSLENILGEPLNNFQWTKAKLPVSVGGMGFGSATAHALGAYLSSLSSIIEEVTQKDNATNKGAALNLFNSRIADPLTVDQLIDSPQMVLSHQVDTHTYQ